MPGRLRREALETMYRAKMLTAKGDKTLDETRELLVKGDVLIDMLQEAGEALNELLAIAKRMAQAIEKHGADVNPKIGDVEVPVGMNVSIPIPKTEGDES